MLKNQRDTCIPSRVEGIKLRCAWRKFLLINVLIVSACVRHTISPHNEHCVIKTQAEIQAYVDVSGAFLYEKSGLGDKDVKFQSGVDCDQKVFVTFVAKDLNSPIFDWLLTVDKKDMTVTLDPSE